MSLPATQPQRTNMLSAPLEAATSIRKACNGIKRMSAISAAAMLTGVDPVEAVAASHSMALSVLKGIGFDVDDQQRLEAVLPMVLEATSAVLGDAARHAKPGRFAGAELEKAAGLGAASMGAVAKSRAIARIVEPSWPADMDATTGLRLTAASAMAAVAVEAAEFDFMHPMPDSIKEAGKVIVKAAMNAARELAPPHAGAAARLMLTQSLIQSGARIYAACWKAAATAHVSQLDSMSDAACEARLQEMEKAPLEEVLAPVTRRFSEAFASVAAMSAEIVAGHEPTPPRSTASATGSPGSRPRHIR